MTAAGKKWVIWQTPLRQVPTGNKLLDIPSGSIVDATGNQQSVPMSGAGRVWSEVVYKDSQAWVYDGYLEDLVEKHPDFEVLIENPTPDPNDAAQYMILDSQLKTAILSRSCGSIKA